MQRRYFSTAVAIVFCLCVTVARAEPPAEATGESVLVLQNGRVLAGKVTRAGDHYFVLLPEGEIRLKLAEVDMVCESLEEVYARRSERIANLNKAADHLELAEFCVRQWLFDEAEQELARAAEIEPDHQGIRLLERRLELARRQAAKGPPKNPTKPESAPSNEELDRMVRGLSPSVLEGFTRTVQPLLLNSCSTSDCHGPRSDTALRLLRVGAGQTPSRRLTQRNLHAVLELVGEEPAESPLLTVPIEPHGTEEAIFTARDSRQYSELVQWVREITRNRAMQPEPTESRQPSLANFLGARQRAAGGEAAGGGDDDPPEMDAQMPAPDDTPFDIGQTEDNAGEEDEDDYVPVDPFDPELFNRQ